MSPERHRLGRAIVIAVPALWLALMFLAPFLIVAKMSISEVATAQPPYVPVFTLKDGLSGLIERLSQFSLESYRLIASETLYLNACLTSVRIAATATVLLLLVGYPVAYAMARAPRAWRPMLMMLVVLPFWTSFLIRVYAWMAILRPEGFLDIALHWLGLTSQPLRLLGTEWAVMIGLVYSYLPFMILPLYAALERIDGTLIDAAEDLGCPPWKAFWVITVPLSAPGIAAGCFLCFIPAIGEFVIPDLLGGSDTLMIGRVLWNEFFQNRDWPTASAVAVLLLLLLLVPVILYQRSGLASREGAS